jgi:PAS domain S-box-containing protein
MKSVHTQTDQIKKFKVFEPVYKLTKELEILFANQAFQELIEMDNEELIGKSLYDLVPEKIHCHLPRLKKALSEYNKPIYFEFPIRTGSADFIWLGQMMEKSSNSSETEKFIAVAKDLTEKVKATEYVKSNEQKYRDIIENINLGLMEVDLNDNVVFANDSFCNSTGYKLDELIGKNASEIFVSESTESKSLIKNANESRKEGVSSAYEVRLRKKDGKAAWMIISGAPVRNADGEVIGSIGIHHDITERKIEEINKKKLVDELAKRNEELLKKQEYLQAINDFVTGLMSCNNIEDVARRVTDDTMSKFGFEDCVVYLLDETRTNLYQVSAFGPKNNNGKIDNPLVIPVGDGIVGSVAATGVAEIVNDTEKDPRYIIDDAIRNSEICVPIIADGEVIGVIDSEHTQKDFYNTEHLEVMSTIANLSATKIKNAIIRARKDISDRALIESEEKLRSVINSALDAVITINEMGIVTEWNPQAEQLFEFKKEEAIGRRLSELIIPDEFAAMHEKGMSHFRNTGEGPVLNKRIEITGISKSKVRFPIELSIVPVRMKGQHFFSAFVRDITPRKRAEEEMQKALQKEKELNEMKSRFVSMTSHEFRTPLTTIKSNIELLEFQLDRKRVEIDHSMSRNFNRIGSEVKRLTDLMNDILMIGRIESGKIPFKPEIVNLRTLCEDVVNQSFAKRKDGRIINMMIPVEDIFCEIDPNIYHHIVSNLVSNAFKYSKDSSNPELHIEHSKDSFKMKVVDYGIGIPEEEIPQLFDSFFRASNVENIQGTGLGLAIVKEFVNMHGGRIDIESELGKGTTISITQSKKLINEQLITETELEQNQ